MHDELSPHEGSQGGCQYSGNDAEDDTKREVVDVEHGDYLSLEFSFSKRPSGSSVFVSIMIRAMEPGVSAEELFLELSDRGSRTEVRFRMVLYMEIESSHGRFGPMKEMPTHTPYPREPNWLSAITIGFYDNSNRNDWNYNSRVDYAMSMARSFG